MATRKLPTGIDAQPKGRYRARVMFEGKQISIGNFASISDAKAARVIALSEIARGVYVPRSERIKARRRAEAERIARANADSRTVRDMFKEWQKWQERRGLKLGSRYTYERHLEAHFMPVFGDSSISSVTPEAVADWLDELERKTGIKNAASVHQTVASLFKWATGDATELPVTFKPWLLASPIPPLAATRLRRSSNQVTVNREPISSKDIWALADGMPASEKLIVLLAGYCGLRLGEVLGLRRRHIEFTGEGDAVTAWVSVETQIQARGSGVREETPKTLAGIRRVPVSPVVLTELVAHLRDYTDRYKDSLLFPRHTVGNELHNPNTVRKHFNASSEALNLQRLKADPDAVPSENFTFHGLRHTALTRLGQAGATTAELKAFAGHSDSDSVAKYQHAERSRLAALAARMTTIGE
ncbi:tyrosine-type recombinase/integrase [Neomicrococcus lactis]|uniref:tyrosine-type recombinase/integrase n=1 Tax=Neomicrococcus lactis TaxID=732241 RepID=UPI00230102AC|nr:site-specific integrase [Neomicrococcus lactis]